MLLRASEGGSRKRDEGGLSCAWAASEHGGCESRRQWEGGASGKGSRRWRCPDLADMRGGRCKPKGIPSSVGCAVWFLLSCKFAGGTGGQ